MSVRVTLTKYVFPPLYANTLFYNVVALPIASKGFEFHLSTLL